MREGLDEVRSIIILTPIRGGKYLLRQLLNPFDLHLIKVMLLNYLTSHSLLLLLFILSFDLCSLGGERGEWNDKQEDSEIKSFRLINSRSTLIYHLAASSCS